MHNPDHPDSAIAQRGRISDYLGWLSAITPSDGEAGEDCRILEAVLVDDESPRFEVRAS